MWYINIDIFDIYISIFHPISISILLISFDIFFIAIFFLIPVNSAYKIIIFASLWLNSTYKFFIPTSLDYKLRLNFHRALMKSIHEKLNVDWKHRHQIARKILELWKLIEIVIFNHKGWNNFRFLEKLFHSPRHQYVFWCLWCGGQIYDDQTCGRRWAR